MSEQKQHKVMPLFNRLGRGHWEESGYYTYVDDAGNPIGKPFKIKKPSFIQRLWNKITK